MLIHPRPLPDELDEGYVGYLMRINSINASTRSMNTLNKLIRLWAGCSNNSGREVSRVELISKTAGLSVTEFVMRHTTLPLRRGITSHKPDLPHGSNLNPVMLMSTAMRTARKSTYFCEKCALEDVDFHGRSYWRRSFQVPGILWCPKHSTPLNKCDDPNAVYLAPSTLIGKVPKVDEEVARLAMDNMVIARYLEICDGLLNRGNPLSVVHVGAVLTHQGISIGFQTTAGKAKAPLLSDALIEQCGREWLSEVLPNLANKPVNVPTVKIDGVFYKRKSASSSIAYALACAVLYASSEEALNALASPLAEGRKQLRRNIRIDPKVLEKAYFDAKGSHVGVARKFGISPFSAGFRLNSMGLPNLFETKSRSTKRALSAFFKDGQSLKESASAAGITAKDLENVLRVMAQGAATAILNPNKVRVDVEHKHAFQQPDDLLNRLVH